MIDSTKLPRRHPIRTGSSRGSVRRPFVPAALVALSAAFLAAPGDAMSQERGGDPVTITGRVVDAVTGDPIVGVQVVVRGAGAGPAGGPSCRD